MNKQIILKVFVTMSLILSLGIAAWGKFDEQSAEYTNSGLKRALIAAGVARGLNRVISVAQGTELSLQPAGVGLNLTPGQILDPINDLVERFSVVMLFSASSLGIQRVAVEISSWPWLTAILAALITLVLVNLWREKKLWSEAIQKTLLLILLVRFAVPAFAMINEGFYQVFLSNSYKESLGKLEKTSKEIKEINEKPSEEDTKGTGSFLDEAKEFFRNTKDSINIEARFDRYKKIATDASEYVVDIISIFVIQTILFPLLFLWLLVRFVKSKIPF